MFIVGPHYDVMCFVHPYPLIYDLLLRDTAYRAAIGFYFFLADGAVASITLLK